MSDNNNLIEYFWNLFSNLLNIFGLNKTTDYISNFYCILFFYYSYTERVKFQWRETKPIAIESTIKYLPSQMNNKYTVSVLISMIPIGEVRWWTNVKVFFIHVNKYNKQTNKQQSSEKKKILRKFQLWFANLNLFK